MTKENLIPKTETICEIKSEIPSFEEFMKTYESDGNLNYDDLNSEVKGYGPCIINGQLNYDNCHCSSSELDRQLKIIRNKRELEALEREKREDARKSFQQRGAAETLGSVAGMAAAGALLGSSSLPPGVAATAILKKLF